MRAGGLLDASCVRFEHQINAYFFAEFLGFMWDPLSWVKEAAALVVIVLSNGEHMPLDRHDFVGIV